MFKHVLKDLLLIDFSDIRVAPWTKEPFGVVSTLCAASVSNHGIKSVRACLPHRLRGVQLKRRPDRKCPVLGCLSGEGDEEEDEEDYLNEKLDHDQGIIT